MKQSNIALKGIEMKGQKRVGLPRKWLWILSVGILFLLLSFILILAIIPAAFPAVGATMADLLREIIGPQPVAMLESVSARLHDTASRHLYTGNAPQIDWNASSQPLAVPTLPKSSARFIPGNATPAIRSTNGVISAAPQIGWQAYGPLVNGVDVMARAIISPDPNRAYAGIALVRMDLTSLQLHMMPGDQEPSHAAQVVRAIPSLGEVPLSDQPNLIAAFNGGFKTVNGHYGMMVDGVTLLPARPKMGTVALYNDGHVQIGAWGKDILPTPDLIAYRQNCPPLIEAGQLNPDLSYDNRNEWGYTGNTDIVWRTGLGITQDGRYLIYAVGNGTTAMTLAQVLKEAGAYSAIQLDINQFYAHFETYHPNPSANSTDLKLVAERLLNKMINMEHIYITPNTRDFFYLTAK